MEYSWLLLGWVDLSDKVFTQYKSEDMKVPRYVQLSAIVNGHLEVNEHIRTKEIVVCEMNKPNTTYPNLDVALAHIMLTK